MPLLRLLFRVSSLHTLLSYHPAEGVCCSGLFLGVRIAHLTCLPPVASSRRASCQPVNGARPVFYLSLPESIVSYASLQNFALAAFAR